MRGEDGKFLYEGPEFDKYRRMMRPEMYNIGSPEWMKQYKSADEGAAGEVKATLGNLSLTD